MNKLEITNKTTTDQYQITYDKDRRVFILEFPNPIEENKYLTLVLHERVVRQMAEDLPPEETETIH